MVEFSRPVALLRGFCFWVSDEALALPNCSFLIYTLVWQHFWWLNGQNRKREGERKEGEVAQIVMGTDKCIKDEAFNSNEGSNDFGHGDGAELACKTSMWSVQSNFQNINGWEQHDSDLCFQRVGLLCVLRTNVKRRSSWTDTKRLSGTFRHSTNCRLEQDITNIWRRTTWSKWLPFLSKVKWKKQTVKRVTGLGSIQKNTRPTNMQDKIVKRGATTDEREQVLWGLNELD